MRDHYIRFIELLVNTEIKWTDGESNPADAMTKEKSLTDLVNTNHIEIKETEWVVRD